VRHCASSTAAKRHSSQQDTWMGRIPEKGHASFAPIGQRNHGRTSDIRRFQQSKGSESWRSTNENLRRPMTCWNSSYRPRRDPAFALGGRRFCGRDANGDHPVRQPRVWRSAGCDRIQESLLTSSPAMIIASPPSKTGQSTAPRHILIPVQRMPGSLGCRAARSQE